MIWKTSAWGMREAFHDIYWTLEESTERPVSPLLTLRGPISLGSFHAPSTPGTCLHSIKPLSPLHLLTFPFCPQVKFRLARVAYEALHSYLLDPPPYLTYDAPAILDVFHVLSKAIFISSHVPLGVLPSAQRGLFPTPLFLLLFRVSFD